MAKLPNEIVGVDVYAPGADQLYKIVWHETERRWVAYPKPATPAPHNTFNLPVVEYRGQRIQIILGVADQPILRKIG